MKPSQPYGERRCVKDIVEGVLLVGVVTRSRFKPSLAAAFVGLDHSHHKVLVCPLAEIKR